MSVQLAILGQHLLNGVLVGCAYALIAMGLTMIFGVMNIANFAHGEFYMLGGFLAFYLVSLVGLNYFVALPTAVYGLVLVLAGFAYSILQAIIVRHEGPQSVLARAIGRDIKGWASVAIYIAGIALSFAQPWLGQAMYVIVAALWLVPDRRIERVVSGA